MLNHKLVTLMINICTKINECISCISKYIIIKYVMFITVNIIYAYITYVVH